MMSNIESVGSHLDSMAKTVDSVDRSQEQVKAIKNSLVQNNKPTSLGKLLSWFNGRNVLKPLFDGNVQQIKQNKAAIRNTLKNIKARLPHMKADLTLFRSGRLQKKFPHLNWSSVKTGNFLENYARMQDLQVQMRREIKMKGNINIAEHRADSLQNDAKAWKILDQLCKDVGYEIIEFGVTGGLGVGIKALKSIPSVKYAAIKIYMVKNKIPMPKMRTQLVEWGITNGKVLDNIFRVITTSQTVNDIAMLYDRANGP